MSIFKDFFVSGKFVNSLNFTFIVMVPKKEGADDFKDFRPISLVGSLYKLIAKVLANKLKKVMSKLVNKAQNDFVEGRQILDASLIANEVIDSMTRRKEKGILCKLDVEKAYDKLNWKFLLTVLREMGFGSKWIGWIKWCISTASFLVIINANPTGFFKSSRGLRQRDPLSSYLFVLGMEVLSIMIDKATKGGYLAGYNFRNSFGDVTNVSHLLFADDTLVFYKDSEDEMLNLSWILLYFEALSGLRINLDKSVILPVGNVDNLNQLACKLGCRVGSLPSSYLGLPLDSKLNSTRVWEGIEKKFRRRRAAWKRQYISKGRRLTLIRSTMSSMLIYLLSLFRMPKSVKSILEKIQRYFLWEGGSTVRKIHLVNWNSVSQGKDKGGLGIRRLDLLNRALLGKWAWRFAMEDESRWRSCIKTKYSSQKGGWFTPYPRGSYGVGFGSLLQKRLNSLRKIVCLNWGTVGKSDFGKTLGVGDNLYVMAPIA